MKIVVYTKRTIQNNFMGKSFCSQSPLDFQEDVQIIWIDLKKDKILQYCHKIIILLEVQKLRTLNFTALNNIEQSTLF